MPHHSVLDTDRILPLLLKLSIPTIIGGLATALYNTVDSIFVGLYVGKEALAALTISNSIQTAFIAFAALCSVGAGTLISRALGAKEYDKVHTILWTGILGVTACTVLLSIIVLIFLDPILLAIGASPRILQETKTYTGLILYFGFVIPLNGVLSGILRAKGQAYKAMYLALLGAGLNIILDPLMIVVYSWGVFGAALATVLAQIVVLFVSCYYIIKEYDLLHHIKTLSFDFSVLSRIFAIGAPSGARLGAIVIASLSANKAIQPYGVEALASFGIVGRLVSLAFMPVQGCNFGAQPIISFNYGAKRLDRLQMILKQGCLLMFVMGMLGSLFFVFVPLGFFRLFTNDLTIMELSKVALAQSEFLFFCFGIYMLLSGFIQSVGFIKEAMFLALIRPLLNAVLYHVFPIFWGLKGVWYVMPFADFTNVIMAIVLTIRVYHKVREKLEKEEQILLDTIEI